MSDLVALDMMDDPDETRPYIERLAAQIQSPIQRLLSMLFT